MLPRATETLASVALKLRGASPFAVEVLVDTSPLDQTGSHPMPWSILVVLFAGLIIIAVVMQCVRSLWKAALLSLLTGLMGVPMLLSGSAFWPAFYAPWFLGSLLGSAVGAVAREERLTALLLVVSAALASVPPLLPYKSVVGWQPPWTSADVFLITFVELFAVAIFTWLFAAILLLVLAVLVAVPVNLLALVRSSPRRSADKVELHERVNGWFEDRLQIVFGILGIVSEVGSSRADREVARLRSGMLSSDPKHRP
jgi:hypothetical protein